MGEPGSLGLWETIIKSRLKAPIGPTFARSFLFILFYYYFFSFRWCRTCDADLPNGTRYGELFPLHVDLDFLFILLFLLSLSRHLSCTLLGGVIHSSVFTTERSLLHWSYHGQQPLPLHLDLVPATARTRLSHKTGPLF